jgi:hypothetical protein
MNSLRDTTAEELLALSARNRAGRGKGVRVSKRSLGAAVASKNVVRRED